MEKYIELILTDPEISRFVVGYLLALTVIIILLVCWICNPDLFITNKKKIRRLTEQAQIITPQKFLKLKSTRGFSRYDFAGVYILHNEDNDKYYVGQGKKVFQRVGNHFGGRGNGDVYADYKYGAHFTIQFIPLKDSGFQTLNELERNTIRVYHAYSKGYNKTRGNRG